VWRYSEIRERWAKVAKGIEVKVSLKDIDLFKDVVRLLKTLLADERIDKNVRWEYLSGLVEIMNKHGTEHEYFLRE